MSEKLSENLRILVGPCRSGSSPLIHALSQSPALDCVYQKIKSALRDTGVPDYGIFYEESRDGRVVIDKETIGHRNQSECELAVFPSDDAMRATSPAFLFRDPVDVWNAWFRVGWGSMELFNTAFQNSIDTFHRARNVGANVEALFYDEFGDDTKEATLKRLCAHWSVDYVPEMLDWQSTFGRDSKVQINQHTQAYINAGKHDALVNSKTLVMKKNTIILPAHEITQINRTFREQYERLRTS